MAFYFFDHSETLFIITGLIPAHGGRGTTSPIGRALAKVFSRRGKTLGPDSSRYRLSRYYAALNNAFTRLVKREILREAFFLWMEPFTAVFSITGIAAFSASWA